MRAGASHLYPRLGRYFDTADELASAACMTRPSLLKALKGIRPFTEAEETAIRDRLVVKVLRNPDEDLTVKELLSPSSFDELFKTKGD